GQAAPRSGGPVAYKRLRKTLSHRPSSRMLWHEAELRTPVTQVRDLSALHEPVPDQCCGGVARIHVFDEPCNDSWRDRDLPGCSHSGKAEGPADGPRRLVLRLGYGAAGAGDAETRAQAADAGTAVPGRRKKS